MMPSSYCMIHERGPGGVGGPWCPACKRMIALAADLATDTTGDAARREAGRAAGKASVIALTTRGARR